MLAQFELPSIDKYANWVASWLEPLSKTGLGFVKWESVSRGTGAYIAIFFVMALLLGRVVMLRKRKIAVCVVAFVSVLVLLLANLGFAISNNYLTEQQDILFWRDTVWKWAYTLLCASIPSFVVTWTYLLGYK
jgi:hypothetical protein